MKTSMVDGATVLWAACVSQTEQTTTDKETLVGVLLAVSALTQGICIQGK